tara:strand:+ start:1742 stop:2002 length:261 start_codon:yes stop_codon:yes gene_type:complete
MFGIALFQGTSTQEMLSTTITTCHNSLLLSLKDLQCRLELNNSNLTTNSLQLVIRTTTNNMELEIFSLLNQKMLFSRIFFGSFSGL